MTQPNDYGFNEDAKMLRDTVRKFFQDQFPTDKLHKLVASDPEPNRAPECLWDQQLWQQIVELGLTAMAVPERAGGMGMNMVTTTAVVEEFGRAAFPSPFIATLNSTLVLSVCESVEADALLGEIAAGKTASLAITNRRGSWEGNDTDVVCKDGKLSGTACYVQDAGKADYFVVSARDAAGVGLYVVPADAEGITMVADAIVDLTRDQAHIEFDQVAVQSAVAQAGQGSAVLTRATPALLVVTSADMCGAAEWQLQSTVEYAKVRVQFDRPIGFFQAIKHPLVNVMIDIDRARSLLYNAACAIDCEPEQSEVAARMAKAASSDAAAYASRRATQSHGGIGFTWECFQHLYFKRQKHNQQLFGDAGYQRARLADLLIGPIGQTA